MIFCLFITVYPCPAEPAEKQNGDEIITIGSATVEKGNLSQAKEKALTQAQIKGIEEYLVRKLKYSGMVNNFQRIVNEIIPETKEAIGNFHILSEDHTGNSYKILVKLRINKKVMDEKLRRAGLAIMEGPAINVLFLILEKDEEKSTFWWEDPEVPTAMSEVELALYNAFQDRGYIPINRVASPLQSEFSEDLRSSDLSDEATLEWGMLFSADVVIRGKTGGIDNEEIFLILKALDTNKKTLICQGMQIQPMEKDAEGNTQRAETIELLVNNLATRLTPAIIKAAGSEKEKIRTLEITLVGPYKQFMDFRDFLKKNVTGVKSVKQTRVRKDSISMKVQFEGDENKFMESILSHENIPFLLDYNLTEDGQIMIEVK